MYYSKAEYFYTKKRIYTCFCRYWNEIFYIDYSDFKYNFSTTGN
jgi:hypothetical protein